MKCARCGFRAEKVTQLPSKAPFSKRFEEAISQACESAAARQVARRFNMAESTMRAIDLRCLERWEAKGRKAPLKQRGVDELYRGKKDKFLTVVCNLETGEPLWFGNSRKKETLDEFFRSQLRPQQRKGIQAACVDMWAPFRLSIEQWAMSWRRRIRHTWSLLTSGKASGTNQPFHFAYPSGAGSSSKANTRFSVV
jgi:transposase